MHVPFLDLTAQYAPIRTEVRAEIDRVFEGNAFSGGDFVEAFETSFAAYCGSRHAVGVGSGTEAIWLAMLAIGVGSGDEVITVPNSFFATAEAISFCAAKPVFVDVDPHTYTMDPTHLEAAITPKTKAIIPVHLFGQTADMTPILEIAKHHGIPVLEDSAQAHGARYKGTRAGAIGAAGCFSFYPGKNLGGPGEAGAVTTSDDSLAASLRSLRDHGQMGKHNHQRIGWNARMDGIQAAVLNVKLPYLDAWNDARRRCAKMYHEKFANAASIVRPFEAEYAHHVYHIYAIRTPRRDELRQYLDERGIGSSVHYPMPIHLQPAYASLGHGRGDFPVAEQGAQEYVSLPMFAELTPGQLTYVCSMVEEWRHRCAARHGGAQVEA